MKRNKELKIGMVGVLTIVALLSMVGSAATGDLLRTITVPVQSSSCCGISIGFDGASLYYTNWQETNLYKMDANGNLLATTSMTDINGNPINDITALSWDASRGKFWAAGGSSGIIYLLDKGTGVATSQFSAGAFDGLAYDQNDDTLWWSPDASPTVHHVTTAGVELAGSPYTPIAASDGHLIPNSGLAVGLSIGGTSYIYLGSNGEGNVYKFNKATFTDLGVFAGVSGRDEDLECDSASFPGKNALWSKDAYNNKVYAFEVETGTCISPPAEGVKKDYRFTDVNFDSIPAKLGELLPDADRDSKFDVKYVLKGDGTVASTNPGQLYAVKTIKGRTVDKVHIVDRFGTQFDVNPAKLMGGVDIIRVNPAGVATVITNTVQVTGSVDNTGNKVILDIDLDTPLGDDSLMVYIKYQTSLKDQYPDTSDFVNRNEVTIDGRTPVTVDGTIEFV